MFKRLIGNLFEKDWYEEFKIYYEYWPWKQELRLPYNTKMWIKKLGKLSVGDENIYYWVMYNTWDWWKTHYRVHPAWWRMLGNVYTKDRLKSIFHWIKFINLDKLQWNNQ